MCGAYWKYVWLPNTPLGLARTYISASIADDDGQTTIKYMTKTSFDFTPRPSPITSRARLVAAVAARSMIIAGNLTNMDNSYNPTAFDEAIKATVQEFKEGTDYELELMSSDGMTSKVRCRILPAGVEKIYSAAQANIPGALQTGMEQNKKAMSDIIKEGTLLVLTKENQKWKVDAHRTAAEAAKSASPLLYRLQKLLSTVKRGSAIPGTLDRPGAQ